MGRYPQTMTPETAGPSLIPLPGGYRKLKSFQVAQLVYDVTVRFYSSLKIYES
jgi:hypothetical protein